MKYKLKALNPVTFILFIVAIIIICFIARYTLDSMFNIRFHEGMFWRSYSSSKMKISFEYPLGWQIKNDSEEHAYTSLCSPDNPPMKIGNGKPNIGDCILFFPTQELINAVEPNDFGEVFFKDFKEYIIDDDLTKNYFRDFKIVQFSEQRSMTTDLYGLYRFGSKGDRAGIFQSACMRGEDQCVGIFKHILNSIQFI